MANDKLNIQDFEKQVAELSKQNKILQKQLSESQKTNSKAEPKHEHDLAGERDSYYGTILNKIADPIFVKDEQSRILIANDAFCDLFELSRKDILGKTLAEDVPPEERDVFLSVDKQVLADGVDSINEENLTVKGNETRRISTKKSRLIDGQGKKYIVGIIHDITHIKNVEEVLRMSEGQFRSLFTKSHVGSAVIGLDKKFQKCNSAFCRFLGYEEKELIGNTIADYTYPEDIELGMNDMKRILNGEIDSALVLKRYVRKDGDIVWGELTISLMRDEKGKPLYFLPVIQDITERNKAITALKENETELTKLNATKDKLFSVIGHDLRSPFNSIINFSDLLYDNQHDITTEEFEKFIGYIKSSAVNALALLDNLLRWAKTQTGQMNFELRSINISSVTREVIELANAGAQAKGIDINLLQKEDVRVYADANIVALILRNLISNAVKFTHRGGEIVVSFALKQNVMEISVIDTGVGMPVEIQNKLFDITDKVVSKGTANEKGSGLGLVLCKEFVEKLGGNIWVKSEAGKGSTFKFTLPLASETTL